MFSSVELESAIGNSTCLPSECTEFSLESLLGNFPEPWVYSHTFLDFAADQRVSLGP